GRVHDRLRVLKNGRGTFEQVDRAARALATARVPFTLSAVVGDHNLNGLMALARYVVELRNHYAAPITLSLEPILAPGGEGRRATRAGIAGRLRRGHLVLLARGTPRGWQAVLGVRRAPGRGGRLGTLLRRHELGAVRWPDGRAARLPRDSQQRVRQPRRRRGRSRHADSARPSAAYGRPRRRMLRLRGRGPLRRRVHGAERARHRQRARQPRARLLHARARDLPQVGRGAAKAGVIAGAEAGA